MKAEVKFETDNIKLQKAFNAAEKAALSNIKDFCGRKVMIEGGGYPALWLETQPMAGEMYAKRNLETAVNNCEIFMDFQRADGRLPGKLIKDGDSVKPHYDFLQGCYLAEPAFELYFLAKKDKAYLKKLYGCLEKFDAYLWKYRDSDGDGCLESWCVWDTGEDYCTRYGDADENFEGEEPPENKKSVPMESIDFMGYSHANRSVLSQISILLANGRAEYWENAAAAVRKKIKDYLWDEKRSACFDRDANNRVIDILSHNTLRAMYFGALEQNMADSFIGRHILNPSEFWTPFPLPSISAGDKAFRNVPQNDWSGQPQGLTYQRAIRAFENYGHFAEITLIGQKFIEAVSKSLKFTQQFDPFTGGQTDDNRLWDYGPSVISTLEFIARLYGVRFCRGFLYWSAAGKGGKYSYAQTLRENSYRLERSGASAVCYINDKEVFGFSGLAQIETDEYGAIKNVTGIYPEASEVTILTSGKSYGLNLKPNEVYEYSGGGFKLARRASFDYMK